MQSYEDFHEIVKARRSIRGYKKDQDVPEETIRKILDVARLAPSVGNGAVPTVSGSGSKTI